MGINLKESVEYRAKGDEVHDLRVGDTFTREISPCYRITFQVVKRKGFGWYDVIILRVDEL